jgi:hypothetical protein
VNLRKEFLSTSQNPDVKEGMSAIFELRDLLANAGVSRDEYMEPLSVLAGALGLLEARSNV